MPAGTLASSHARTSRRNRCCSSVYVTSKSMVAPRGKRASVQRAAVAVDRELVADAIVIDQALVDRDVHGTVGELDDDIAVLPLHVGDAADRGAPALGQRGGRR